MSPRVFLVTGSSTGFGKEYVQEILAKGDYVAATARKSSSLSFEGSNDKNLLLVDLDVTSQESIEKAFDATLKKFGRVDVVCNNAGYGLSGEFESLSDKQIRTQMEVNFFGLLDVTRKAMEVMREQKPSGGVIQQVTSIGGQRGVPTFSIYCASKWQVDLTTLAKFYPCAYNDDRAVEGATEAISHEVKPEWGIKFTLIEPGGFRTDWAGRSMDFGEKKNPAYDHINAKETMGKRHGTQAGDPVKAGKVFYELAVMKDPPLRVVVGSDAYKALGQKLETYQANWKRFEELSNSTDVDGYERPA